MGDLAVMGIAIGSGLAALGVLGPAIGVGLTASKVLEGTARQPEVGGTLFTNGLIFAAMSEALGIFAWVIAILLFLKLG